MACRERTAEEVSSSASVGVEGEVRRVSKTCRAIVFHSDRLDLCENVVSQKSLRELLKEIAHPFRLTSATRDSTTEGIVNLNISCVR